MVERVIRVSGKVKPGRYIYDAKTVLRKHGEAEFHAVGGSILSALKTADRLVELGYASLEQLQTESIEDTREGTSRVVGKLVITLRKTDNFETLDEEYKKQRAANQ